MVGQIVGSYRIERELGMGGMGAVYLAKHTLLDKYAAVKMLRAKWSADQEAVDRFFTEARATTSVRHGGIVDVYDFGYHKSGSAFLVMELLEGETLGERIRREETVDEDAVVNFAWQAARALAAAHVADIIHRDLKPDNIFLSVDPAAVGGVRVKLLDFGIAKLHMPGAKRHTNPGEIVGTPLFMSPEHCVGGHVDGRSDVYSLACVVFYAIAGRPPFCSDFSELLRAHVTESPPSLAETMAEEGLEVSAGLSDLLDRCLAKKPDDRPTANEMAEQLQRLQGGPRAVTVAPRDDTPIPLVATLEPAPAREPTPAPAPAPKSAPDAPATAVTPTRAASSRRRTYALAAAAVLVVSVSVGAVLALSSGPAVSDEAAPAGEPAPPTPDPTHDPTPDPTPVAKVAEPPPATAPTTTPDPAASTDDEPPRDAAPAEKVATKAAKTAKKAERQPTETSGKPDATTRVEIKTAAPVETPDPTDDKTPAERKRAYGELLD